MAAHTLDAQAGTKDMNSCDRPFASNFAIEILPRKKQGQYRDDL
jgi:hypothetical protein